MWLVVAWLYGAGLRLQECLELRVKDLDFDRHEILVRRGKGQKDRRTMLPTGIEERLRAHLREVKRQHEQGSGGRVRTSGAALCPGSQVSERRDRVGMAVCVSGRSSLSRSSMGSTIAVSCSRIGRAASGCGRGAHGGRDQTRWVSHISTLVRNGVASGRSRHSHGQELLGHADVTTTMVYTHVLNRSGLGVRSPFDRL
jgi:integrase